MPRGRRAYGACGAAVLVATMALLFAVVSSAGAATIAYPDLQLLMPTNDVAIATSGSTRELEFTHVTWDAGAGPWELDPSYNALTGIAQGYQELYTSPSPGQWTPVESVPVVGPMVWEPPSDYRFPLDSFKLYTVASGGGLGALVATSPKVDFCMTNDTFVGGVPNAPTSPTYNQFDCNQPNGVLGLTVGWGDEYDQTDGGEDIDISSLPSGDYWLQGIVDPYHYFLESNNANNVVDTELQISGSTVTVLQQTEPSSPPPTVALTSPAAGSTTSGSVPLTATASGPNTIASVQFLLDGQPLGPPVTTAPYTMTWTVGSTAPGPHFLSAQALDSNGFYGTAPDVSVTVPTTTTTTTTTSSSTSTSTSTSTTTASTSATTTSATSTSTTSTASGPTVLLGDQAVASTPDSNSGGLSEAFGFTATASGTATSASVYLDSTAGVSVGLYADSAGRPGTLLSTGTVGASTAHTWATVSLSPAVQIASGTRYWIALQGPGTGPITYHDSGSSGSNLDFSGTGLASPYSTTGQWSSNPVSAYVSGTPSTTTTTTTTTPTTTTTTTPTTTTKDDDHHHTDDHHHHRRRPPPHRRRPPRPPPRRRAPRPRVPVRRPRPADRRCSWATRPSRRRLIRTAVA